MKKLIIFSFLFLFLAFSNAVLAQTTTIVSNTTWSAAVNNQPLGLSAGVLNNKKSSPKFIYL